MHHDTEARLSALNFQEHLDELRRLRAGELALSRRRSKEADLLLSSEAMLDMPEAVINLLNANDMARSAQNLLAIETGLASDIVRVALLTLEFFELPIVLLACLVYGKKITIDPVRIVKWFYTALATVLIITAFALPLTAPVIGFIFAGFSLATAAFALEQAWTSPKHLKNELGELQKELQVATDEKATLLSHAEELECRMQDWVARLDAFHHHQVGMFASKALDKQEKIVLEAELATLYQELSSLKEQLQSQEDSLSRLQERKAILTKELAALNIPELAEKALNVVLAKVFIIGLGLSLVSPVGWYLLMGVALVGATYLLGKLTLKAVQWCMQAKVAEPESLVQASVENTAKPEQNLSAKPLVDRVASTLWFPHNAPDTNLSDAKDRPGTAPIL